jgi:predicted RND superfamily exporter protein
MNRLEKASKAYVCFLRKRYTWVLVGGFLLTILAGLSASRFTLKTDFAELLPQDEPSVKDLKRAKARMRSMSNLMITIEGENLSANRKLTDDLVKKYLSLSNEYVVYLRYHINDEKGFFKKNKHLFADLKDLEEIHKRLARKIRYERIRNNPVLSLDFDGTEPEPVDFDLSDIKAHYQQKTSSYDHFIDGYFTADKGRIYAIMLYPPGASTGVTKGKKLIRKIQEATAQVCAGHLPADGVDLDEFINTSCKKNFDPSIRVGWTGSIVTAVVEQKAIIDDLVMVTGICLSLVGLVVLLYFRMFRSLPIIGIPLLMGTAWTFGLSYFIVDHLNTSTAFLAAIIVGNGINFGLIQLARYVEERRLGTNIIDSLSKSIAHTAKATSVAALAASIAYGSLILTDFRGFNGFGYMGGLGMIICWFSAFSVQPAFLLLWEHWFPSRFTEKKSSRDGLIAGPFAKQVQKFGLPINALGWIFAIVCIVVAIPYLKDPFEYDFRNLRNQNEGVKRYDLAGRIEKIFPRRLNPLFILADRQDQVPLITEELERNNKSGPHAGLFQEIRSIYTYLPADQVKKIRVLKKTKRLLSKSTLSWLSDEDRAEIDKYIPPDDLRPLTVQDLPLAMTRVFTEKSGRLGLPLAIYPNNERSTWDGHFLMEIADASRTVHLPDGDVVTSSGAATIFADMIKAIERDGPKAVIASLIGVMLLVFLAYRKIKYIVITLLALFFGVFWTIGPVAMIDMKLNFLNFIALPITFGIGIDYAVNVLNRYRIEGPGSMHRVVASTGGAVALCSLTTLIGYSSLLIADNNALVSFGLLADLGEVASLAAALVLLPAMVHFLERFKRIKRV